jgi:hypothetical protein
MQVQRKRQIAASPFHPRGSAKPVDDCYKAPWEVFPQPVKPPRECKAYAMQQVS